MCGKRARALRLKRVTVARNSFSRWRDSFSRDHSCLSIDATLSVPNSHIVSTNAEEARPSGVGGCALFLAREHLDERADDGGARHEHHALQERRGRLALRL